MKSSIYLLVSDDEFLIEKKVLKILESVKTSNTEIVKYDLEETPIERVVEDLDTCNFLCDKKIIIARNAFFLTGEKVKTSVIHDIDRFLKYLNHPSQDNILIISCGKLDNRKKIVDVLNKVSNVELLDVNLNKLVRVELGEYQMNDEVISFFVNYVGCDSARCISELEKLKLYKYDDKVITKEDIITCVSKTVDDSAFLLADAIINKDKKKAIEIYQAMLLHNQKITDIVPLVASKFRLMYQIKILEKKTTSLDDIASILGVKKYPVTLLRDVSYNYSDKQILTLLSLLADLDYNIKTSNVYEEVAFEQFIFSL